MSEQQIQKVKVRRLTQVGLWATDVPAQARFYRQALGFALRSVAQGSAEQTQDDETENARMLLALNGDNSCLGLFADTRAPANGRIPLQHTRLHHLSFEVDADAELAALAARLNMAGVELELVEREGDAELQTTLRFSDPDGNPVEVAAASESLQAQSAGGGHGPFCPAGLQHVALQTPHLEAMVEFYTEALGFDISDWLLRECAWLRCNSNHHTLMLIQGRTDIDHVGYSIQSGAAMLASADHLSRRQIPVLWGPGRHGAGNDLFLRFADAEGLHIELSAELQQYYDEDATTPPRLWHTRPAALNLWGGMPAWIREHSRS